jgi:N-acetylglucosamine-6-phosphate deacetylase
MTKIIANVPLLDGVFEIGIEADKIVSVIPGTEKTDLYAGPTLFDIQVNGYGGKSFWGMTDDNLNILSEINKMFVEQGVGLWIPTVITDTHEALLQSFSSIAKALDADPELEKSIPGLHLEGPYISKVTGPRGVHKLDCIRPADWDEFVQYQDASGGRIKYVTLAPEVDGNIEFIKKCVESGVIVSIGHSDLDRESMNKAVDAGVTLSTHLGNGAHDMIQRHNNYIWYQLASRKTFAAFISDGQHLPSECLTSMIHAKGLERSVITSDCVDLGGMPAGIYGDVEKLPNGRLVATGTPNLAGSASNLRECVEQVVNMTDLSHAEGWKLASIQAAKAMGLPDKLGIEAGKEASITVYRRPDNDYKIEVVETWVAGCRLFSEK